MEIIFPPLCVYLFYLYSLSSIRFGIHLFSFLSVNEKYTVSEGLSTYSGLFLSKNVFHHGEFIMHAE